MAGLASLGMGAIPTRLTRLLPGVLLALAMTVALACAPARAETPEAPEAAGETAIPAQDLEALVETLEDDPARARLVQQLRALIAAQDRAEAEEAPADTVGAQMLAGLSARIKEVSGQILAAAAIVVEAPRLWSWLQAEVSDGTRRALWVELFAKLALVIGLGLVAEWVARRLLRRARAAVEGRETDSLLLRLPFLATRTILDLIPIAAFAAAAYGVLPLIEPDATTRLVALTLINASVLARAALAVARMALVPRVPSLRVIKLADETAFYAFLWVRRLTNFAVYGYFIAEAAFELGLPAAGYAVLLKAVGLILAAMVVILILQNRRPVARLLGVAAADGSRLGTLQSLRARFADIWHVVAVLYVIAIYLVWALQVPGGFEYLMRATALTAVILAAAKLVATVLRRLIDRTFTIADDVKARLPELDARANRYLPVLHKLLRAVVYIFAALAMLEAWGVDTFEWLTSGFGQRVAESAITIATILLIGLVVWEGMSWIVERYLNRTEAEGRELRRSARVRTLVPLLHKALSVVLGVLVTLTILSELGVDIAPLLAGAGVIGLAIGFGAQTLVKDVITGVFILVEDTIAVGDVVDVGDHAGMVEAISIRTIRLRDLSGNVHTVPFNEVSTVLNMTKDFSYYMFEIGVAYREDVDEVAEVLKEIGAEIQADPDYAPHILEPLEVLGLDKFADSAVIIKARIKTKPIKQWIVGREFNRRMKKRFDELGIEIPFPHTTIYFGEDRAGVAPPARVRMEAAAAGKEAPAPAPAERKRPAAVAEVRTGAGASGTPDPGGGEGGEG